jgi:hypothetical protein
MGRGQEAMAEPNDRRMQYLLGRLPEPEQEDFEQESLMDDERFEELVSAEDDLIDAYVAGQLGAEDARRFEARFLAAPARRERVEFARALSRLVESDVGRSPAASRRGWSWWLPLAASVAAAAVGGWSLLRVQGLAAALSGARGEQQVLERRLSQERARAERLAGDLAASREGAGGMASWTLEPGGERDPGRSPVRVVPADAEWVRLRLRADSVPAAAPLRVVVETAEGQRVALQEGLRPRPGAVEVILPAALLAPGSYVVVVGKGGGGASRPDDVYETYALTVSRP